MGKRSSFRRLRSDRYLSPLRPVLDLQPYLPDRFRFVEPCAANGQLVDHLRRIGGTCMGAIDIMPGRGDIQQGNALRWMPQTPWGRPLDYVITNPPWTRAILHRMIKWFIRIAPTWLLFDANWLCTRQSKPYRPYLRAVLPVGRVKWFPGSRSAGKDDAAWYLFSEDATGGARLLGDGFGASPANLTPANSGAQGAFGGVV